MADITSTFNISESLSGAPEMGVPWLHPMDGDMLAKSLPAIRYLSQLTIEKIAEILAYDRVSLQAVIAESRPLPCAIIGNLMTVSYIGTYGSFVDEFDLIQSPFGSAVSISLGLRLLNSSLMLRPNYLVAKLPPEAIVWKDNIDEVASVNGLYVINDEHGATEIRTLDIY